MIVLPSGQLEQARIIVDDPLDVLIELIVLVLDVVVGEALAEYVLVEGACEEGINEVAVVERLSCIRERAKRVPCR